MGYSPMDTEDKWFLIFMIVVVVLLFGTLILSIVMDKKEHTEVKCINGLTFAVVYNKNRLSMVQMFENGPDGIRAVMCTPSNHVED